MKVTLTVDDLRYFFCMEADTLRDLADHYEKINSVNSGDYKKECLRTVRDQRTFLEASRRRFEVFAVVYGKVDDHDCAVDPGRSVD